MSTAPVASCPAAEADPRHIDPNDEIEDSKADSVRQESLDSTLPPKQAEALPEQFAPPTEKQPVAESSHLQVVDGDGVMAEESAVLDFIETQLVSRTASSLAASSRAQGVRYHVVAIFGGQSTGKSTLLNEVFHTKFETMNESLGRPQTTRGAFLALSNHTTCFSAAQSSALFVMDFEGTDGVERGEDQRFERQLSLFALSCSDVVIVNMRTTDVGRHNAANIPLLRTIFEVNLQLFCHDRILLGKEKPTLLVILRDFGKGDFDTIKGVMTNILMQLWDGITKPAGYEGCALEQLFHLRITSLPHFEYAREQFDLQTKSLRSWFTDSNDPNFVFQGVGSDTFRGIPLEGLPAYLSSCWLAIQSSRDLNIPSQRDMLAKHRCLEFTEASLQSFGAVVQALRNKLSRGEALCGLIQKLESAKEEHLVEFFDNTKLYSARIAGEFRAKLAEKLSAICEDCVRLQCKLLAVEAALVIDSDVQELVDTTIKEVISRNPELQLATTSSKIDVNRIVQSFWERIADGMLACEKRLQKPEAFLRFAKVAQQDQLIRDFATQLVLVEMHDKIKRRMDSIAADASTAMHRVFEQCLNHGPDGQVRFFATPQGIQSAFPGARFAGLVLLACVFFFRVRVEVTTKERDTAPCSGEDWMYSASQLARSRSQVVTSGAAEYDDDENDNDPAANDFFLDIGKVSDVDRCPEYPAIPRGFLKSPPMGGDEHEDEGDGSAALADSTRRPRAVDPSQILLSKAGVRRAYELYQQQCNFTLLLQVRSIENGQQAIPMWMWGLVAFLGHQEFIYVVTSPVLMIFIAIVSYVFFKNWILLQYQRFQESGPPGLVAVVTTGVAIVKPLVTQIQQGLQHAAPGASLSSHESDATAAAKKNQ